LENRIKNIRYDRKTMSIFITNPPDVTGILCIKTMFLIVLMLVNDRYNVKPNNIVGHADIAPGRKFDPSGYFDWKRFNSKIGIFNGLFNSKLSPEDQKKVLMDWSVGKAQEIGSLQKKLADYGYKIEQTGKYDQGPML
jgi:N-acetylmuramoyl-L-alanine amidase